jgi:hypothetical protein
MMNTYNQLKELAGLYQGTEDTNLIALKYQDTEDAVLLAYTFCKHIGVAYTQSEKFFGLTPEDLESFALEELHKAMMNYDADKGASLTTLYSKFLCNRLRAETQANNYDKRKCNNNAISFEGSLETEDGESTLGVQFKMGFDDARFDDIDTFMELVENVDLTPNEYRYCEIYIRKVTDTTQVNDSDIAHMLGISSAGVHHIKKKLKQKFSMLAKTDYSVAI